MSRIRGGSSVHPTSNVNSKLLSNLRIVLCIRLFYAIEFPNLHSPTLLGLINPDMFTCTLRMVVSMVAESLVPVCTGSVDCGTNVDGAESAGAGPGTEQSLSPSYMATSVHMFKLWCVVEALLIQFVLLYSIIILNLVPTSRFIKGSKVRTESKLCIPFDVSSGCFFVEA